MITWCCAHPRDAGYSNVSIYTVDSGIPLHALYFKDIIGIPIYDIGVKNSRRRINFSAIFDAHGTSVASGIVALHSFVGNYYTSAFHGLGKKKAFKLLKKSETYQDIFKIFWDTLSKIACFKRYKGLFANYTEFPCAAKSMERGI